jgi:hypothetical protein
MCCCYSHAHGRMQASLMSVRQKALQPKVFRSWLTMVLKDHGMILACLIVLYVIQRAEITHEFEWVVPLEFPIDLVAAVLSAVSLFVRTWSVPAAVSSASAASAAMLGAAGNGDSGPRGSNSVVRRGPLGRDRQSVGANGDERKRESGCSLWLSMLVGFGPVLLWVLLRYLLAEPSCESPTDHWWSRLISVPVRGVS